MTRGSRIGLYGGTFDPLHVGHLIVASDAFEALELDRLLFIPSADPPHKRGQVRASAERRLEMVRAAIAGDPRFGVEDLELRREGASYTVDTLRDLRERNPGCDFFFLVGVDQVREFHSWREPEEVARLARLAVVSRGGEHAEDVDLPLERVDVTRIDLSSTDIRRRVAEGESIRYLVPDAVREIVEREALYR